MPYRSHPFIEEGNPLIVIEYKNGTLIFEEMNRW
jgi:hypothetical protein